MGFIFLGPLYLLVILVELIGVAFTFGLGGQDRGYVGNGKRSTKKNKNFYR